MAAAALNLEPKGELLSISAIAKKCKLDRATVTGRLEDLGYDPAEDNGRQGKLYLFTEEMEFEIKAAKDTVTAIKIQDLRWAAKLKRQKYERESGDLVSSAEMTDIVQRVVKRMYDEQVNRAPKRIAGPLVKAKTLAAVKKVLKTEADRVMKMLRADFQKFIDG